jgi:hypothetical protein
VDRLDRATGSWVFSDWQPLLKSDGIPFCTVTFHQSDDPCGSAKDHAKELGDIVGQVKNITGQKQVNIVGYSKGGLDASSHDVHLQSKILDYLLPMVRDMGLFNLRDIWITC